MSTRVLVILLARICLRRAYQIGTDAIIHLARQSASDSIMGQRRIKAPYY